MPSLRSLRQRKRSIQSTKKITSAMKMIAATRLRRAQERAERSRPYAGLMATMLSDLIRYKDEFKTDLPKILTGTGQDQLHLLVLFSSNRGLCGSFNSSLARKADVWIRQKLSEGKEVKIICMGRKVKDQLARFHGDRILETNAAFDQPQFYEAARLSDKLVRLFEEGQFDICTVLYNKFISALAQQTTERVLIPLGLTTSNETQKSKKNSSFYEYEPSKEAVLKELLPRHLRVQIYQALLESAASEQAARMTAMDGATRNAEDMIGSLNIQYNRLRQAYITKELIEIISGAEAL